MSNLKKITFNQLREALGESVKNLSMMADYNKINKELDRTNFEGFCKQLDFLATSQDPKAQALFNTFKKGWKAEYGDVKVSLVNIKIQSLRPTQNVIFANKSLAPILNNKWNIDGYNCAVDAFVSKQSPLVQMGDPLVVCEVGGVFYLIDGHHRWSKAYAFNPNCRMRAYNIVNSDNIFKTADDVLKFAQGTLTALRKQSPINDAQPTNDPNLYMLTYGQLQQIVNANITPEVEQHIVNSTLVKQMRFDKRVAGRNRVYVYLWGNIRMMRGYAPAGKHDRIYMPQYPNGDSNPISAVDAIAAESTMQRSGRIITLEELSRIVSDR